VAEMTRSPGLVAAMLGGFDDPAVRDEVRGKAAVRCAAASRCRSRCIHRVIAAVATDRLAERAAAGSSSASAVCIAAVPGSMWLARRTGGVAQPDATATSTRGDARASGHRAVHRLAVAIRFFRSGITERGKVVAVTPARPMAMAIDDILDLKLAQQAGIGGGVGVLAVVLGITITSIAIPRRTLVMEPGC